MNCARKLAQAQVRVMEATRTLYVGDWLALQSGRDLPALVIRRTAEGDQGLIVYSSACEATARVPDGPSSCRELSAGWAV